MSDTDLVRAIGLISGTSMDGIDAAAVEISAGPPFQAKTRPVDVAGAIETESAAVRAARPAVGPRQGFKVSEFVVYPAHGVGQIVAVEDQEVAGFRLELFVINFAKDKMTLRVPTSKVVGVGMRKLSDPEVARKSLDILTGRARIKRTMWSRRAQEYEAKINSGDINAIAEVVRDLYRSEAQPEQSYSERQLYEAALDRIMREIAAGGADDVAGGVGMEHGAGSSRPLHARNGQLHVACAFQNQIEAEEDDKANCQGANRDRDLSSVPTGNLGTAMSTVWATAFRKNA